MKSKCSTRACARYSSNKLVSCKRSQEEMIGFVLIIVIVSIVALIFLGMSIRKDVKISESEKIDKFLDSALMYTTACAVGFEPQYLSIEKLIKKCYDGEECLGDRDSCDVLEEEFSSILEETWLIGPDVPTKYYEVYIYYREDQFEYPLVSIEQGNCSGNILGASGIIHKSPGDIITDMQVCTKS
ncbi:MAG: hypothetical protein ABIH72_03630 [archaeon]